MRYPVVGYAIAVVVGAGVGAGTALFTSNAFVPANEKAVLMSRDSLRDSDDGAVDRNGHTPHWRDELELALPGPQSPPEKHAGTIGSSEELNVGLELAGDTVAR